jgi:hypothetical protein
MSTRLVEKGSLMPAYFAIKISGIDAELPISESKYNEIKQAIGAGTPRSVTIEVPEATSLIVPLQSIQFLGSK